MMKRNLNKIKSFQLYRYLITIIIAAVAVIIFSSAKSAIIAGLITHELFFFYYFLNYNLIVGYTTSIFSQHFSFAEPVINKTYAIIWAILEALPFIIALVII